MLYVGLSFNGVERPLATTHARLRHFQPGDRVTIWRAPADPVALYDLEAVLIRALRPRYNVAAKPCQTCGSPARAGAERCVACARRRKNVEALQVANVEAALTTLGKGEPLMRRRRILAGLLLTLATPLAAEAQPAGKVWRIGYLAGSPRVPQIDAFVQGLRELGYIEGRNLSLEMKLAHGRIELLPQLAAELVQWKPDVIVAAANVGGLAAKKATGTIPVVVVASHDGVKVGLFASLARPGGNLTGIESLAPDLDVKRLEFLKQALPKVSWITVLYNSTDPGGVAHVDITKSTARSLGFQVRLVEVRSAADFDVAFAAILRERPDALLTVTDPLVFAHRERITQFTVQNKIPAIFEFKAFADLGGLMSYGPNMPEMWRRAAYYADRILKGAKPAELPVEQPTKFELVINLKTAKALGLTIPPSLLLRADQVIE